MGSPAEEATASEGDAVESSAGEEAAADAAVAGSRRQEKSSEMGLEIGRPAAQERHQLKLYPKTETWKHLGFPGEQHEPRDGEPDQSTG